MGSSKKHIDEGRERDAEERHKDREREKERDGNHEGEKRKRSPSKERASSSKGENSNGELRVKKEKLDPAYEESTGACTSKCVGGVAPRSIEETNKLRAKFGLKPLELNRKKELGTKEEPLVAETINYVQIKEQKERRKKLAALKEKRLLNQKLGNVKTVAEEDPRLDFQEVETVIPTLQDKGVLEKKEDVLVNVGVVDREKADREKNEELKKKPEYKEESVGNMVTISWIAGDPSSKKSLLFTWKCRPTPIDMIKVATLSAQDCIELLSESDEDNNSSCPDTADESEEERRHDPAEDLTDDDDDDAERPRTRLRSRSKPASQASRHSPWKTETAPDVAPPLARFRPVRPPGVQLYAADNHTLLDLFKLFVTPDAVNTLCKNTNKQAAKAKANGSKYTWTDVGVEEFYRYIGLLFYMAMVKLHEISDYWRQNSIFSCPFPATIMPRDRYRTISWNVHMSDPDMDQENDSKRGTPQYDKLFRLRPFMDTVQHGCKAFFHPRRNLSVDERMVAWKANSGMTQYMKAKPIKWGFKLFVLCDSSTGYTVDFSVYPGSNYYQTGRGGLPYDTVMSLVNHDYLGSGYHVYVDNFYTSPKLFRDLLARNIGACGTYRDNRKDFPRTESNALTKKSPRGSIRWIRDGPLVFVKWVDTKVVHVCSTIHAAFAGDTAERRVKQDGVWISKDFPCPSPIIHYNKYMGGVDLSDQLIQYYTAQHKTMKWYRKLFLHFLDIAATNAYLLHKELASLGQREAMAHKAFQEELIAQLCGVSLKVPSKRATFDHVPVPTATQILSVQNVASIGRKKCVLCRMELRKQQVTPWKCKACDIPLCLQLTRNCFEKWHQRL